VTQSSPRPPRGRRPIPPGSPADAHRGELGGPRLYLDRLREHHLDLVQRFLSAADGALYTLDLVFGAVMTRSYSLVDGFLDTFDQWNPIVAAPLLRLQIDSLVRTSYIARAPAADSVANEILGGGEFRKMKDAQGKKLLDFRLVELAKRHHPWVPDVYEVTSGWVHFSPDLFRAAWQGREDSGGLTLSGAVPLRPEQIPVEALQELIGAMIKATEELFGYSEAWEARKGLPLGEARGLSEQ
jgi:hypothetical protein